MRKQLFFVFVLFFALQLSAQIEQKIVSMSTGDYEGFEITLPVSEKEAEKIWKDYLKPFGKLEWDRKLKEYSLKNVRISSITQAPISILSRIDAQHKSTKLTALFQVGDEYLNKVDFSEESGNARTFMQKYLFEAERLLVQNELNSQEKELTNLNKEFEGLIKKNKNLHQDIEKAKAEIINKEREVEVNVSDQKQNQQDVEKQRALIRETTMKLNNIGKSNQRP